MTWRRALLGSALAGLLSAAAFDPWSVPYAMVVAVAIFFAVLRGLRDARVVTVMAAGAVYGLTFMAPLIWWMNAVSHGAYVGLVLAETILLSVLVLPMRAAARLPAWPLWIAAAWVLAEEIRGSFPFSGFPWGRLAHTAADTPLDAWVRILGMPGLSALLAVCAALLVVMATSTAGRRLGAVAVVVAAVLAGLALPVGVASPGESRRIVAVQGDVPGAFLTWPRGEIGELHLAETERFAAAVERGDQPQPDLVIWPENALDVDPYENPRLAARIEDLSERIGSPILIGAILDGPDDTTAYNAGIVWSADGPGERYVKRKLVPYGEYVPFRQQLGALVPRFDRDIPRDLLPGDEPGDLSAGGELVVGDTICWDIAYDGIVREAVDGGAQFLAVQTSNASFTGTSQPAQQFTISRLRAIETGRWVVVPSTNGISGIVDARGQVVERAPLQQPATLAADVTTATGSTPALQIGPWLRALLVVLGAVAWVWGVLGRRGTRRRGRR